jgi:uncharacterized protein YjbI with pentapeptide repeats
MTEDRNLKERAVSRNEEQKPDAPAWLIENIAETSRNARKIYFLYIGFLVYGSLTVMSTSDRQIILNDTAKLPIVNLDVSLSGFFVLAPIISILVFIYFQLYLHRLKGLMGDLLTNYAPVRKRRLYPWILNIAEDPEPGAIGALQRIIAGFSVWALLTLVLAIFAFSYVKKHEPFWSYVIGVEPLVGFLITFWFWKKWKTDKLSKSTFRKVIGLVSFFSVIIFELSLLFFLIPWASQGGKFEWLRPYICVNLSYQKLINEPRTDYEGLYWGDLSNLHLEGADLTSSVLKRANLANANLLHAKMRYAILDQANLKKAILQNANLGNASFQHADLEEADLRHVILTKSNFRGANLKKADLREASVELIFDFIQQTFTTGANFQNANLLQADLRSTQFYGSNFRESNLRYANLQNTMLSQANLRKANIRDASLQNAVLSEVIVGHDSGIKFHVRTNLEQADLRGADLKDAKLDGANLRETDLRGAKNLTLEQLSKVSTLYKAQLDLYLQQRLGEAHTRLMEEHIESPIDPEILEEIRKAFPGLLVEPVK